MHEADRVDTDRDSELTVRLTNEHRAITRDLGRLRTNAKESELNPLSSDAKLFAQLAGSLDEHFRKEEQLLFPILGRSLGSDICERLSNEHAEIVNITRNLSAQTRPLEESFNHLEQLFRAHTSTEENVLFWYLDLQQRMLRQESRMKLALSVTT